MRSASLMGREISLLFYYAYSRSLSNPETESHLHFSPGDRLAEHITFTAATLDGVAAFVSPFIDNVLQHPEVYRRLVNEISSAETHGVLSSPVAQYEEILTLPYFTACIKECLRRDAPAQTILPRVVPDSGLHLPDGSFVPPGTEVGASPYIVHRDENYFGEHPERFIPERWLGRPEDVQRMERYGMWWGYGDRECAGKYYALMEMQKLCLELFRRFEIRSEGQKRYIHEKWAVGMYWNQDLAFKERKL
ncbi:MAG: hypothetical protein MMC33_006199 [Icmadophila ericetorum]|nr:hypothetical protein [Icmadophila ericetorum]